MNRRDFVRTATVGLPALVGSSGELAGRILRTDEGPGTSPNPGGTPPGTQSPPSIRIEARLQARAFAASSGDDGRYHAVVYEEGGAAPKSLLTTPVSDAEIAARLRDMGAGDGGGVPMLAWTMRKLPLVPWPNARVRGTPMRIRVAWDGWHRPRSVGELLRDPGGRGVSFRFGGNEEHDETWPSGCIACLYSCPGGVASNESYTIRDKVRGATRFTPVDGLPEDGTPVSVTLELLV